MNLKLGMDKGSKLMVIRFLDKSDKEPQIDAAEIIVLEFKEVPEF